jgi:hypothetical protein
MAIMLPGAQHAVHQLAIHRGFDRIGDHFARYERVLHTLGSHADAVGDRGKAEHLRLGARGLERGHGAVHQRLDARIAGIHRGVAVGHADDRLVEVAVLEAHGAQHGAIGRARHALGDQS